LASVLALDSADRAALGALAPALKDQFGVGNEAIGLLASAFAIVGGIATIPVGVLTDRTRRITILVVSIGIWTLAMGVAAAATAFMVLFAARVVLGVVTAASGPPVSSIVGDLFPPAERGRVLGKIKSGELIGAAAGFLITGLLVSLFTWRSVFVAFAVLGALLAFRVSRVPEPPRVGERHPAHGERSLDSENPLRETLEEEEIEPDESLILRGDMSELPLTEAVGYIVRVRTLSLIILANAFGEFFFAALQVFGVLFLVDQFDISASTASFLIPAVGVAGLVGVLAGGQLGDWLVARHVLTGRIDVGAWSYLAVALLFIPVLIASSLAVALPFLVLAGGFLMAPVAPLEAARLDVVHPQLRGRAESARTVARVLAQAAAPLLFGILSEAYGGGGDGLRNAFLTFLPLLALSSVLLWAATRRYPRELAAVQASTLSTGEDESDA